jgi:hypothetical protein
MQVLVGLLILTQNPIIVHRQAHTAPRPLPETTIDLCGLDLKFRVQSTPTKGVRMKLVKNPK